MQDIWKKLYEYGKNKIFSTEISPYLSCGSTVCTILCNNKIYSGVNIYSNNSMRSSAEKNAIIEMLNNGDFKIEKIVIVNELEEIVKPCKECLELITTLDIDYNDIEILLSLKPLQVVKLGEVLPSWWGTFRLDDKV